MFKNKIFFLNVYIVVTIIFILIGNYKNIINAVLYPFDIAFSEIQKNLLSMNYNRDKSEAVLGYLKENNIKIYNYKNIQVNLKQGLPLWDHYDEIIAKAETGIKPGNIVVDNTARLIGFVNNAYGDRVTIRKLGYGENEIFGEIDDIDVLIKEFNGKLLVEIPEGYMLKSKNVFIKIPEYIDVFKNTKMFLVGTLISKYSDNFYLFEPVQSKSLLYYFLEGR